MTNAVVIGLMSLAGILGYLAGAVQGLSSMERAWLDGYAAGKRATRLWHEMDRFSGKAGDHG